MAEYIERKQSIAVACKGCNKEFPNEPCEPSECYIQQGLFNIAAADVVEVVRCKDCKRCTNTKEQNVVYCKTLNRFRGALDFCSYGERKDNG